MTRSSIFVVLTLFALVALLAVAVPSARAEDREPFPAGDPGAWAEPELIDADGVARVRGDIEYLRKAPDSVVLGDLVSDSTIFMFAEELGYELEVDLVTDLSEPGDYFPETAADEDQTWEALGPGVVPAGTTVNSYYFHYDNESYNDTFRVRAYLGCSGQYRVSARITFDEPVLGVVMRAGIARDHLGDSNDVVGLDSVEYDEQNLRHFPGINIADGCKSDRFVLSEDRLTLTVVNNTDVHHDNYRVITAAS